MPHIYEIDLDDLVGSGLTSSSLFPYLLHFGKIKITPEIADILINQDKRDYWGKNQTSNYMEFAMQSIIRCMWFRKIKGQLLHQWLSLNWKDIPKIEKMYETLGRNVGYIHKYGVVHGHLKSDNIIVESDDNPVIIDWKHGEVCNTSISDDDEHQKVSKYGESNWLLGSLRKRLGIIESLELFDQYERMYRENRLKQLHSTLEIDVPSLYRQATEFINKHLS